MVTVVELLREIDRLTDEVRARTGDTTGNQPIGALTEALAARVYKSVPEANPSTKGYDVIASDGRRIQVKSRRAHGSKVTLFSAQFHGDYDAVLCVVFTRDWRVDWAAELTYDQAIQCSTKKREMGKSLAGARHIRVGPVRQLLQQGLAKDMTDVVAEAFLLL